MSGTLNGTLDQIRIKTENLIELCEALKEQNELLGQQNNDLRLELEMLEDKGKKSDEKISTLLMARSVAGQDEKSLDIKQKINEFVQEIDKCITLLNK